MSRSEKRYPPSKAGLHEMLKDHIWFFRGVSVYLVGPSQIAIMVTLSTWTALTLGIYSYFVRRKVKKLTMGWLPVGTEIWRLDTVPL